MKPSTLFAAASLLFASQAGAAITLYTDQTFNDADWTLATYTHGTGGSTSAVQVATGGNPGSFRSVTDTVSPSPSGVEGYVLGFHHNGTFNYVPAAQGAIATINYAEDSRLISGGGGDGEASGAAVLQDGVLYIAYYKGFYTPAPTWTSHAVAGLTAADFDRIADTSNLVDATAHPDFSAAGDPIGLGFYRANSTSGGGPAYTTADGIDNLSIGVQTVPEPGSAALLAVTSGFLIRRLRRPVRSHCCDPVFVPARDDVGPAGRMRIGSGRAHPPAAFCSGKDQN